MKRLQFVGGWLFVVVVCCFLQQVTALELSRSYDNCQIINAELDMRLHWTVNGDQSEIEIAMEYNTMSSTGTAGWFAFSPDDAGKADPTEYHPNNENTKLDLWLAGRSSSGYCGGGGCIIDAHMQDEEGIADNSGAFTDVVLTSGGSEFAAEFKRPVSNAGDTANDWTINLAEVTDLWYAYGTEQRLSGSALGDIEAPEHCGDCVGVASVNFGATGVSCEAGANNTYLSPTGEYQLRWTNNVNRSSFTFEMSTTTAGWISTGFSQTGSLGSADFLSGWIDSGGVGTLLDGNSHKTNGNPSSAETQDFENVTYSLVDGVSVITFDRLYSTAEAGGNDVELIDADMYLYWGVDAVDGTGDTFVKHDSAGSALINFFNANSTSSSSSTTDDTTDETPQAVTSANSICEGTLCTEWVLEPNGVDITFTLIGQTSGYVSIGIGETASVEVSDMYVAWVDGSGVVTFLDSHNHEPVMDTVTDFSTVVSGSETGGVTTIVFTRPLLDTTTSGGENVDIVNKEQYLIWATGTTDGSGTTYDYHSGDRGLVAVNFVTGAVGTLDETLPSFVLTCIICGVIAVWAFVYRVHRYTEKSAHTNKPMIVPLPTRAPSAISETLTTTHLRGTGTDKKQFESQSSWLVIGEVKTADEDDTTPVDVISHTSFHDEEFKSVKVEGKHSNNNNNTADVELQQISTKSHSSVGVEKPKSNISWYAVLMDMRVPGTSVAVRDVLISFIYVTINVICLFVGRFDMADNWGYLSVVNIFFVILPATRNSLLVSLTGVSMDHMIHVHRWMGRFAILCVTIHGLWFLIGEWSWDFAALLSTDTRAYGLYAWFCGVGLFATSLEFLRRKYFDFFFYSHILTFLGLIIFAYLHTTVFQFYFWAAVVIYAGDRLVRFMWGAIPVQVIDFEVMKGGFMKITFEKHPLAKFLGLYDIGQYVFVNFPFKSWYEFHPFSVASGPREETLTIGIKSLGDHTKELIAHGKALKESGGNLWLRCDGPYGNIRCDYRKYEGLMLFGGGVGVTPILGLAKDMFNVNLSEHAPARSHNVKHVHLVWTVPSTDVVEWFQTELAECIANAGTHGLPQLHLHLHVTRNKEPLPEAVNGLPVLAGRPNVPELFSTVAKHDDAISSTLVFACGPSKMVDECWDCCTFWQRRNRRFDMHHEIFEF